VAGEHLVLLGGRGLGHLTQPNTGRASLDDGRVTSHPFRVVRSSSTRTRRLGGLLLAVVLVASQAAAWVHATAVAHVTCIEHGEAIHAPTHVSAPEARRPETAAATVVAPDDVAGIGAHEHCESGALLRWRALAIAGPPATIHLPP